MRVTEGIQMTSETSSTAMICSACGRTCTTFNYWLEMKFCILCGANQAVLPRLSQHGLKRNSGGVAARGADALGRYAAEKQHDQI